MSPKSRGRAKRLSKAGYAIGQAAKLQRKNFDRGRYGI